MVDLLIGSQLGGPVQERLQGLELHVPAHFDAEVLSALGRLHRSGHLSGRQASDRVNRTAAAPIERHALPQLLSGAWSRRRNLRLVDALYVELASQLDTRLITTDAEMAVLTKSADLVRAED